MRLFTLLLLLGVSYSPASYSISYIQTIEKEKTHTVDGVVRPLDRTSSCTTEYNRVCVSELTAFVEPIDIQALEQKIQISLSNITAILTHESADSADLILDSEELKEAIRTVVREQIQRARNTK